LGFAFQLDQVFKLSAVISVCLNPEQLVLTEPVFEGVRVVSPTGQCEGSTGNARLAERIAFSSHVDPNPFIGKELQVETEDFTFEFNNKEVENLDEGVIDEAENRLRSLAEGKGDMVGAAVAVKRIAHGETPHWFQARVVVYIRGEDIVAFEKAESPEQALKGALEAAERQIRKRREKQGKPWERPKGANTIDQSP
jgi:ribosome-associated translation inhibitor RaiA